MDLLGSLQNPRRREILRLCWDRPRPAGEIWRELNDVSFGAISQQLALLHKAGLVAVTRAGRERHYLANRRAIAPLRKWLETEWDSALYRLKLHAELEASRRGPRASTT